MAMNAKGSRRERQFLEKLTKEGYLCHRIAGSGVGSTAICDIIAIKDGVPHLIEVKSRKKVYYTRESKVQLEELVKAAKRVGAKPVLAVKLNNKEWKTFDLSNEIPKVVR